MLPIIQLKGLGPMLGTIHGTRQPTPEGARVAQSLAAGLAQRSWTIVSGLALTMFGIGITALFGRGLVGLTIVGFERVAIPGLNQLPVIGKAFFNQDLLIYFSFLLVAAIAFFFLPDPLGAGVADGR